MKKLVVKFFILLLATASILSAVQLDTLHSDEMECSELIDFDEETESENEIDNDIKDDYLDNGFLGIKNTQDLGKTLHRGFNFATYSCDYQFLFSPPPETSS